MQAQNPPLFQSTHLRWRAIAQRDPTAHFSFIYGVKTTKIYCRPTCTARVARRANIVYYETPAEAQLDGFRPCVKCKPDDSTFLGQQEEIVMRTLGLLRNDVGKIKFEGGVKTLAKDVGVTPSYLCRVFKKTMGCTLSQYCEHFDEIADTTPPSLVPGFEPVLLAGLSEPVCPPAEHPASVANRPETSSEYSLQPSTGVDDSFGTSFDFDEWLWTEEPDLQGCRYEGYTLDPTP